MLLLLSPILGFDPKDPHGTVFFAAVMLYTTPIAVGVLIYWYRLDRRRYG